MTSMRILLDDDVAVNFILEALRSANPQGGSQLEQLLDGNITVMRSAQDAVWENLARGYSHDQVVVFSSLNKRYLKTPAEMPAAWALQLVSAEDEGAIHSYLRDGALELLIGLLSAEDEIDLVVTDIMDRFRAESEELFGCAVVAVASQADFKSVILGGKVDPQRAAVRHYRSVRRRLVEWMGSRVGVVGGQPTDVWIVEKFNKALGDNVELNWIPMESFNDKNSAKSFRPCCAVLIYTGAISHSASGSVEKSCSNVYRFHSSADYLESLLHGAGKVG